MLRIGDFARLGQVTVATLRHYDELGLMRPARVDDATGYRFYGVAQLTDLNRILALKDLGFSLGQVKEVLAGVTTEELRGMLKLKQAEAAHDMAEAQARLNRVAVRIAQMEQENEMPDYEVVLKEVPPILVASRRVTIPTNDQVPVVLGAAFGEAYGLVKATGARETGPCIAVWHQPADVFTNEDAEAIVQIDRLVPGNERVAVYELAGGLVASVLHRGDFTNFIQAHAALLSWIEANGYESLGTYREVYLQEAAEGVEAATEVQYPVVAPKP
ncbi:MAG: MerR family transcriptional regulator [bacterium]